MEGTAKQADGMVIASRTIAEARSDGRLIVVIHDNDPDGFGSAYAAWRQFGDAARYVIGDRRYPEEAIDDAHVVMLDMTYGADAMLDIEARAASFTLIDHHHSALPLLQLLTVDTTRAIVDVRRSAAALSWIFINPDLAIPDLIAYVEDNDIWTRTLPDTDAIACAISALPFNFGVWDAIVRSPEAFQRLRLDGVAMQRMHDIEVASIVASAFQTKILGHRVPIVNCSRFKTSSALNHLALGMPFAAGFRIDAGRFYFSFRSDITDGIDVSEIAKAITPTGGGHRNAAGAEVDIETGMAMIRVE